MHYFNNLALEEVAQRLGRPLGTVKVYLHRARKLLYKRIKLDQPVSVTMPAGDLVLAGA
jgi:DNA-directed RNA polymerase specialized sigma24 family protein